MTTTTAPTATFSQLDTFVGQSRARMQLKTLITAAKARRQPLSHILLASGLEGLGKTTLAQIIGVEMAELGGEFAELSPTATPGQALDLFEQLPDFSVVFVDEAHIGTQGGKNKMDWWLPVLENNRIQAPNGRMEELPLLTFVWATTDAGALNKALRSRFTKLSLERYTDDEAVQISVATAVKVLVPLGLPDPTKDECAKVARAASNNPRVMRKLWEAARDLYAPGDRGYKIATVLDWWGYTEDGLTTEAVRYLITMQESFKDGAGERAIADAMHEPGGLKDVELQLFEKGLLEYSRQGRILTKAGRIRARDLIKKRDAQD